MLRLLNSFKVLLNPISDQVTLFSSGMIYGMRVLRLQFPHLHSFVINKNLIVKVAMEQDHL
jgi:hypothetical protein